MNKKPNTPFHYLARGILSAGGKVLLARQIGAGNTFLPGGHIDHREKADAALIREIYEEIGETAIVGRFIGAVEAGWAEDGFDHHEINLVFEVTVPNLDSSTPPESRERHLEFLWANPSDLAKHNLQPAPMMACITQWREDGKAFWGTAL